MKLDMKGMLEQAQKMQAEIERIKQEVQKKTVTAESGGGLVSATMSGSYELVSLKISRDIVNPEELDMLEDLIIAAINKASYDAQLMVEQEMKKVTGFLPQIPGLNLGL